MKVWKQWKRVLWIKVTIHLHPHQDYVVRAKSTNQLGGCTQLSWLWIGVEKTGPGPSGLPAWGPAHLWGNHGLFVGTRSRRSQKCRAREPCHGVQCMPLIRWVLLSLKGLSSYPDSVTLFGRGGALTKPQSPYGFNGDAHFILLLKTSKFALQ